MYPFIKKEIHASQENVVCFFRFSSMEDAVSAYDMLLKNCAVLIDLSAMDHDEIIRLKDFMQGICFLQQVQEKEICEDFIAYFPSSYHLQIYEN